MAGSMPVIPVLHRPQSACYAREKMSASLPGYPREYCPESAAWPGPGHGRWKMDIPLPCHPSGPLPGTVALRRSGFRKHGGPWFHYPARHPARYRGCHVTGILVPEIRRGTVSVSLPVTGAAGAGQVSRPSGWRRRYCPVPVLLRSPGTSERVWSSLSPGMVARTWSYFPCPAIQPVVRRAIEVPCGGPAVTRSSRPRHAARAGFLCKDNRCEHDGCAPQECNDNVWISE